MTNKWIAMVGLGLLGIQATDKPVELKTDRDRQSYALGVDVGRSFKRQKVDVNPDALAQGLRDVLGGKKLQMTDDEMTKALNALREAVGKQIQAEQAAKATANKKAGEDYLAANKTKQGVTTLPSGVQYKVLKAGTGPKPKADSTVDVRYVGKLIDGTVFDQSDTQGPAVSLNLGQVIPGWREAIPLMGVGSKWEITIPSNLAYGDRGAGDRIGPNSVLIFEVELVAIK